MLLPLPKGRRLLESLLCWVGDLALACFPLTRYPENNPEVMTELAHRLGCSTKLAFHDVYSIYDADLLAMLPRPVYALLVTVPLTPAWKQEREAEDSKHAYYTGKGPGEPVLWFRQTIPHGCGLIGLLHCLINGAVRSEIAPNSELSAFIEKALPLGMDDRAQLLKESQAMYDASESVAAKGDTEVYDDGPAGNHYIALVRGFDGHLWELEGSRKGPLDRGALGKDDDALSEKALDLGLRRLVDIQKRDGADNIRFSATALAPSLD